MTKPEMDYSAFQTFVDEFKGESDRAAVILGAAKLDSLLAQILDHVLLPSLSSTDELLEGDSPLATFSSRINVCYRIGIITPEFAKSLHLVRRIRNGFAHELSGCSLDSGSHSDRVKSLLLPLKSLPFFTHFRSIFFGESSPSNNFKACLSMMAARLESRLLNSKPFSSENQWTFVMRSWADEKITKADEPNGAT